ncbi:MAG TPA: cupin domain-containing protein [Thermoanaerobaculia bacterium]|nr:cupin domain-containing protein [Thermoanaerobaculia bacterium]
MKRTLALYLGVVLLLALAAAVFGQDPLKVAPQAFSEKLNNDQVRILTYHSKPGQKEAMHSHPASAVYLTTDCKLKFTMPDGKTSDMDAKAGDVRWREATVHAVENVGKTECKGLVVELKEAAKK